MTLLALSRVSKSYPGTPTWERWATLGRARVPEREALRDIDLSIDAGEIVGLLGPNGSGKSTLLRCAAGLLTPTSGTVRALGGDPVQDAHVRGAIGFTVRDGHAFNQRLSGRENLHIFALLQQLRRADAEARVETALEATALCGHADVPYRMYSSGMKQRLSVARALLGDPRLLLMDEATSGLDPGLRAGYRAMVRRLADAGVGVLFATHDLGEAEDFCSSCVVLDEGRIVARGTWAEVARPAAATFGLAQ